MNSRSYYQWSGKILLTFVICVLLACGSDKKKGADASEEFDAAQEQMKEKVESTLRNIPPPAEIPYIIQGTGADFNPSIVNDHKKYESYTISAKKAAFNLGVYATDIGYLSSYGKTQEALNYMDVSLKLMETMGTQDAVNIKVMERFEKIYPIRTAWPVSLIR